MSEAGIRSPGYPTSVWLCYKVGNFPISSFRFDNLLKWLIECRKALFLLLQGFFKKKNSGSKMEKKSIEQGNGEKWNLISSLGTCPSQYFCVFTDLEEHHLGLCMAVSVHGNDWWNHCPLKINSISHPWRSRMGMKVPSF